MSRKFSIFSVLVILAMLLAACGGGTTPAANDTGADNMANDAANDSADTANNGGEVAEGGEAPQPAAQTGESILDRVKARGSVVCGARTDLLGFGYLDADGNNVGFDADLCRAVAAVVLGDANAVEFVPLSAADRGPALQTAEVDLLSRNVTWTGSRDVQWGNFTTIMFYDAQGFMVRTDSGITSLSQLDGATICVTSGTTTEQQLADYFRQNNLSFEAVIFEDTASVYGAYEEGRCDATTSDVSQLGAVRAGFADPAAHVILDEYISKEPLTPGVPHGDDAWFDVVRLTMNALILAEEYGVTSANVGDMMTSENINILRLLGQDGDWGYSDLGLAPDAFGVAIAAVGNYGEIYNRYMGPDGESFVLPRGLNDLYTNGGLLYGIPIK
jgi:general L-amino acid transport system substrate-binding protein